MCKRFNNQTNDLSIVRTLTTRLLDSGDQSFKTNIWNGIYTKATNIKMPIKRGRNVKNANANTTETC